MNYIFKVYAEIVGIEEKRQARDLFIGFAPIEDVQTQQIYKQILQTISKNLSTLKASSLSTHVNL